MIVQLPLLQPACIMCLVCHSNWILHCCLQEPDSSIHISCSCRRAFTLMVSGCSSSILTTVSLPANCSCSSSSSWKSSMGLPAAITMVFSFARICRDSNLQSAGLRVYLPAHPAVPTWVTHSRPMPLLAPVISQVVLDIWLDC